MRNSLIIQSRKNPQDLLAPEKYYLTAIKTGRCDLERLAYLISNQSTVREPDCLAVLNAFVHNMLDELEQGRIVELGSLGSFQIGVNSYGSETEEEVGLTNIRRVHLKYRAGRKIRKKLKTLEFTIQRG